MKIIACLKNALRKVACLMCPKRMESPFKFILKATFSYLQTWNARGKPLPSEDHIVRYVKPSMIGNPSGKIRGMEFRLREDRPREIGLSVNWLEAFTGDKKQQILKVLQVNKSWFTVRNNGCYAEFNVGQLREDVNETLGAGSLQIIHDPLSAKNGREADPSHSEIRGLPIAGTPEARLVGDLILEAMRDQHPVSEISTWGEQLQSEL